MADLKTGGLGAVGGFVTAVTAIAALNGGVVLQDEQVTALGQAQAAYITNVKAAVEDNK